jgi:hypothetical protein
MVHGAQRISEPPGACIWSAGSHCTRRQAAPSLPSPEPSPLQPPDNTNQTDSLYQPSSAKSRGNRSAPLDSPVTQMTRPAKGALLSARAPAASVPREAEEEATEAAEEGWCIPGSTSLPHPLLATTSTPLLRGIAGEAGGGTRAAHVGETLKGRQGSVRRGESKAEGLASEVASVPVALSRGGDGDRVLMAGLARWFPSLRRALGWGGDRAEGRWMTQAAIWRRRGGRCVGGSGPLGYFFFSGSFSKTVSAGFHVHAREVCLQQCGKAALKHYSHLPFSASYAHFCMISIPSHPGVGPTAFAHPLP